MEKKTAEPGGNAIAVDAPELYLKKDFAEIREIRNIEQEKGLVRVYCTTYPNGFNFQIRTFKPITEMGSGKPRAMIATVSITIKEMESILAYMKGELKLTRTLKEQSGVVIHPNEQEEGKQSPLPKKTGTSSDDSWENRTVEPSGETDLAEEG